MEGARLSRKACVDARYANMRSMVPGPHTRFREAIDRRLLPEAEAAARELEHLGIVDALALTLLLLDERDPRFDRAATRWIGRLLFAYPKIGLKGAEEIARALRGLDGVSENVARSQLGVLIRGAAALTPRTW